MENHLLIAYTWSAGNIGDIGITPGILRLVSQQKPNLPVELLAMQPEDHPHYQQVKHYYSKHAQVRQVHPNCHLIKSNAWQKFTARWGENKIYSFQTGSISAFEAEAMAEDLLEKLPRELFQELVECHPELVRSMKEAGFLLYNSGMTLNFGRAGMRNLQTAIRMAMPMLLARVLDVPYGINAQSFEAIEWPMDLVHRPLFEDACFVYCRDSDSAKYLQHRGISNLNSGFRPDSTFFFQNFDKVWAKEYMQSNGLEDKQFISVILRLPDRDRDGRDPTPGATAVPGYIKQDMLSGKLSEKRLVDHMNKIKAFIDRWVRETGQKVLILHETRCTLTRARERLWKILSEQARQQCVYMDEFATPEQAYSLLKHSRLLVSMEMHSVIMALNVGTPTIHVPFAEAGRKRMMLKDIGAGDWLLDIDDCQADDIFSAAMHIHHHYIEAQQRIQNMLPGLEARAHEVLHEVWSQWKHE